MTLPEEENFLRIVYLHYRVVTPSLKRFFDGKHPNLSADLNLPTNKAILSNLHNPPRGRRILHPQQWNTLYPPTGSPPVVSNVLDLTLMVCLLRNIPPVVCAPVPNGFDQLPLPNDISDGANIERIKHYKNFLVSHSTDGILYIKDLKKIWTDLETAIKGLGNAQDVADANLAKSIILDGSMKKLLSTQLTLEAKVLHLQDQMETVQYAKIIIQRQIQSIEEQIITNELKTSKQMEENKNNISRSLQEMQDKNHGELTQINITITNLEECLTTLNKFQVDISDKFEKLDISVSQNKTVIDDLKCQVDSICIEINSYILKLNKRIDILEKKTTKQVNELREEIEYLKANRKKVPDWMIDKLEQWKKEDEYFVNTRASEWIKDCLQKHVCVSVVGPSGVGKSFLVQHVALEMIKDGYTIMKVNSPEEIKENFMSNRPTLFVVDDFCGNFTANTNRLDAWKKSLKDISKILETNAVKIMFTCRLQVFQDEGFKHSDFHLFRTCICNLVDKSIALIDSEKESMLLKYFGNADTKKLKCLYQYDFFPLLCKLLNTKKDQSNFFMNTFLEDPFSSFENELNDLFVDCNEGKYKIIALLLLVICNNHLDKTVLCNDAKAKTILEDILEDCCINEHVRLKSLIKELDTLTGTFVSNEKGVYHTIHDKLFDFLAYYFGTKNEVTQTDFAKLLIRHADKKVIEERFVIKEPDQSHDSKNKEYVITVQGDNLQLYTKRVFDDMKKPNDGMECLWLNRNRKNKTFQDSLCIITENLQDDEISNLIKTSSSGFVCSMFVMDVNNITMDCPYGIILDHAHLQAELIKRMFDDMTKSNEVSLYTRYCECFRNKKFCTEIQSYMTNISLTRIKELIKSCSTSFVDLMFIMEKEDIKLNTPYEYMRYGVVIPTDIRRDYIGRVFEDTSRSNNVYAHINHNRNQTNTIFRTELLHFIERLDRSKIQHLIEHASQDFIDRLCVMTMEDTDVSSNLEDECYGVVIPTDCMQLYMTRWFDGLTKSCHIEGYFEHNRNRHTEIFQTSLLTFMAELQDDKIESLIQTASNDFLRKMFVTTKKDIKHESDKEYEHYGIELEDQYLALYTKKLLGSTEVYEDLINDMKDNRTIRQVINYTRTLHILKITELIQTARDVLVHEMIEVVTENELKEKNTYSDCQSLDYVVRDVLELNEGLIKCPFSLIRTYMDRMIIDWGKGNIYVVIKNKNLKNQSFVNYFSDHLKQLEPSTLSDLVHIKDNEYEITALSLGCTLGNVNFAKWCLNIILSENPEQEQTQLCALFLLVVFNNKLEERVLNDDLTDDETMILDFRNTNNIKERISAMDVKRELTTSLNRTIVNSLEGFYFAIVEEDVFDFFVYYFASIRHMPKLLVKYAAEKVLYQRFMLDKSFSNQYNFFVELPGEDLRTCIIKVFKLMPQSEEITRYTLDKDNHIDFKSVTAYAKTLTNREIKTIIKTSCIDFINKMFVLAGKKTKDHTDEYMVPYIVIPDDSINTYMKIIFFHMAKHDCVEGYLQDNRNKNKKMFRNKLKKHMSDISKTEVIGLIQDSSSDFINRMFVISEENIKNDSYWEYERYGIIIPEDLLQIYNERVFSDMTKSIYMPVNRNNGNKLFRDTLYCYTNSFSKIELKSLMGTASSKCIRQMFLSEEGESVPIISQRFANYHIFIPDNYYRQKHKYYCYNAKYKLQIPEDDLSTFTITTYEDKCRKDALITVKSKRSIDELQHSLSKYIDPMFTSKVIEISVSNSKLPIEEYIQWMIDEWKKGNIHDVFGNVNFCTQSFRSNFLTHLKHIETSTKAKLTETIDNQTGDSPLAVSCRVGIIELVDWCLDNNADTNNCNNYDEHPLYIACNQNHPDIVHRLLHSNKKANANKQSGTLSIFPLYEACKNGNVEIVSILLRENIDVNEFSYYSPFWETALYVACKYGHIEIVSLLLDCKTHPIDIYKGKIYRKKTPLYIACKRGHTDIVSLLLKHDSDELLVNQCTDKQATSLYAACKGGYTEIVRLLLDQKVIDINTSRIDGASPLWIACQKGHVDVVSELLDHKCIEVDKCMLIGISPLCIASLQGHIEIVKMLLEKKADAEICVNNMEISIQVFLKYRLPFYKPKTLVSEKFFKFLRKVVLGDASEHVKSFTDRKEEDLVFNSMLGASPLHMSSLMGHTEIVKLLVKNNSNINSFNENGSTPLFLACELGHEDIACVLLANMADPTLDGQDGKSPLTIARDNGHMQIVEIIQSIINNQTI
ncbi:uncharacterized protein [Mytilus edulis]|uniref:uncharacterized protein n=1 Tax=Mytilus edulis TaxID=6550 RepID=UPI0039F0899C